MNNNKKIENSNQIIVYRQMKWKKIFKGKIKDKYNQNLKMKMNYWRMKKKNKDKRQNKKVGNLKNWINL